MKNVLFTVGFYGVLLSMYAFAMFQKSLVIEEKQVGMYGDVSRQFGVKMPVIKPKPFNVSSIPIEVDENPFKFEFRLRKEDELELLINQTADLLVKDPDPISNEMIQRVIAKNLNIIWQEKRVITTNLEFGTQEQVVYIFVDYEHTPTQIRNFIFRNRNELEFSYRLSQDLEKTLLEKLPFPKQAPQAK